MRIELHPEAQQELDSAALWYDAQRPGLGEEFLDAISATFIRILDSPASFPTWPNVGSAPTPIRRALAERFPYAIAFESSADRVAILAVAHAKRRPLYWIERVR